MLPLHPLFLKIVKRKNNEMKERVRYITIRFICLKQLSDKDAWFIVSNKIKRLFGTIGSSEIGLFLSHYDVTNQGGIFRCSHNKVYRVRAALCFIHNHQDEPLYTFSENLTGSLQKAKIILQDPHNISRYQQLKNLFNLKRTHPANDDLLKPDRNEDTVPV